MFICIVFEFVLRNCDGKKVMVEYVKQFAQWVSMVVCIEEILFVVVCVVL